METISVSAAHTTRIEVLADLLAGANQRFRSAAWDAKHHAELITQSDRDPLVEISAARLALDNAERMVYQVRDLTGAIQAEGR